MTDKEKIQYYRSKNINELDTILESPELEESDVVIATIENNHKKLEKGIAVTYSTQEVLEHIFGTNRMVRNS